MKMFLDSCQSDQDHKVLTVYMSTKTPDSETNKPQKLTD